MSTPSKADSKTIILTWIEDDAECEECGFSYAEGATVLFENGTALDFTPVAYCQGGIDFSREEVYKKILEHLGYRVLEDHQVEND